MTPHEIQSVHDDACQLGARCGEVDDVQFLESHEQQIQGMHDLAVEHGASCEKAAARGIIRKSATTQEERSTMSSGSTPWSHRGNRDVVKAMEAAAREMRAAGASDPGCLANAQARAHFAAANARPVDPGPGRCLDGSEERNQLTKGARVELMREIARLNAAHHEFNIRRMIALFGSRQ
jgi:hypothetical protein